MIGPTCRQCGRPQGEHPEDDHWCKTFVPDGPRRSGTADSLRLETVDFLERIKALKEISGAIGILRGIANPPVSDAKLWASLDLGLYRVFWKDGGSSIAAVGMKANGQRWLAPTNWTEPSINVDTWDMVLRVETVRLQSEEKP